MDTKHKLTLGLFGSGKLESEELTRFTITTSYPPPKSQGRSLHNYKWELR